MPQITNGYLFAEPYNKPLSTAGQFQAGCYRKFYATQTTTLVPVYQDAGLTAPYSQTPTPITADSAGRFSPIYLDPSVAYRVQLFSAANALLEDVDPVGPMTPFSKAVAKQASTNRTTTIVADDPDLVIPVPAAGIYEVMAMLYLSAAVAGATPGISLKFAYTGSLDATAGNVLIGCGALNNVTFAGVLECPIGLPIGGLSLGPQVGIQWSSLGAFIGTIKATTPGNLSFQWSQGSSSATPTVVGAGSMMRITKVG